MAGGAATPPEQSDHPLVELHAVRDSGELDEVFAGQLRAALAGIGAALLLLQHGQQGSVRVSLDERWPVGQKLALPELDRSVARMPLRYGDRELGWLLLAEATSEETATGLRRLLDHYAVALVNLTLHEEVRGATDSYCASLQALQEGIVLFQETDPEAVTARLMGLATTMLQATAGALYVLDEVGNPDSELRLTQTLGIPEALLQTFRGKDGQDWPRCLLDRPPFFARRDDDATLGGLDAECLPEVLADLACLPLRYHGVTAGVCLLFNLGRASADAREQLERMNSLGELAAALLHRLSLEAIRVRSREIETQLEIAEVIQRRLLPEAAPDCQRLEFAWRSIAARHIGGDYLDLLADDRGRIHGLIADASGHGVDSALLMTAFRSTYRAEAPRLDPGPLLARLNRDVAHDVGGTGMFLTAAALRIDPGSLAMDFSSAGHNPVLWYRAEEDRFEELESEGPPLGFLPEIDYGQQSVRLQPGDLLVLYTDGITEGADPEGEMFGDDRLRAAVREHAGGGAQAVLEGLLAALSAFTRASAFEDDVSITVLRVR